MKIKLTKLECFKKIHMYQYETGAVEFGAPITAPDEIEIPVENLIPTQLNDDGTAKKNGGGAYLYWIGYELAKERYEKFSKGSNYGESQLALFRKYYD